jgi:hypothetical protein
MAGRGAGTGHSGARRLASPALWRTDGGMVAIGPEHARGYQSALASCRAFFGTFAGYGERSLVGCCTDCCSWASC